MGFHQRHISQEKHRFLWVSLCLLLSPIDVSYSDSLNPGFVDCNSNGIPDSDDIDLFLISDCNENGIPDDCDIALGFSLDLDGDGFPDDCICLDRQFITSPNEFEGEFFGLNVDVSDGWAVAGAVAQSPVRVYQFISGQWQLHSELMPGIPVGGRYSNVVAIDQGVIAIGDQFSSRAAVHVFRYDIITVAWQYEATLFDDLNTLSIVRLGNGIAMTQNRIAVGLLTVNFEGAGQTIEGEVQIHRFDNVAATWSREARIAGPAGVFADDFAYSIDMDNNLLGVVTFVDKISMYRYDSLSMSWNFEADLEPGQETLPGAVAVSGNVVVVADLNSSLLDSLPRESEGKAQVYRYDGAAWNLEAFLYPTNTVTRRRILQFGKAVDADLNYISITSNWTDNSVTGGSQLFGGAVHTFRHDGTTWIADGAVFQYPDGLAINSLMSDEGFGRSIAMDGIHVIVSAPQTDNTTVDSGAVYFFTGLRNPDLDTNGLPDACEIVIGDISSDGLVNITDLLILLSKWGPCPACPADINADSVVNVIDLLLLLSHWD